MNIGLSAYNEVPGTFVPPVWLEPTGDATAALEQSGWKPECRAFQPGEWVFSARKSYADGFLYRALWYGSAPEEAFAFWCCLVASELDLRIKQ